jgi:ABC-type transport system involved in multi-copper enzyme maturation permease subunit
MRPIIPVALNTFREAVRDRILYNLVVFALLMIGASLLLGQITIGVERQLLINLGLTAISAFGILIAIFIGIGLVSKEIDKRTIYTVLTRPIERWEFIVGKYFGLVGTLTVNTGFMTLGFFAALLYLARSFQRNDLYIFVAIYFILLSLMIITAVTLLFSSFSTPIESAVLSFGLVVAGSFNEDLRGFAAMSHGPMHYLVLASSYVVPNLSALNVIAGVANGNAVPTNLLLINTGYAITYVAAVVCGASLIFQYRNLK